MRELRMREHEKRTIPLTMAQRDALLRLPARLKCTPVVGSLELYDLQASSWVGVVRAGDLMLAIEPKIAMDRVLHMLAKTFESEWFGDSDINLATAAGLHEVVARIYARLLRGVLARGVPQGYEVRDEALTTVRGRVRFDDQLRRRLGLPLPVEVRFDEFTEDIELNRILKAAGVALQRVLSPKSEVRQELLRLDGAMQRVADVQYVPRAVPDPILSRLTDHVRPALKMARWILTNHALEMGVGTADATALLFDMNRVFEDFLFTQLRACLGLSSNEWLQGAKGRRLFLDGASRVPLKPDLSWWVDGRCVFIGDAKYKVIQDKGAPPQDLYQLLTYLVATGLQRGLLIYGIIGGGSFVHRIQQGGRELWVEQIDLTGTTSSMDSEIVRLAQIVRQQSGQRGRWGLRGLASRQ